MTKVCSTCGEPKARGEFYRDKRNRDDLGCECKACVSARRKRDRAKARAVEAVYRQKHRETLRERGRRSYAANREKRIDAVRQSRARRKAREQVTT